MAAPESAKADGLELQTGGAASACLRAEKLQLSNAKAQFQGVVKDVEYGGATWLCVVETDVGPLRVEVSDGSDCAKAGEKVGVVISVDGINLVERA
jgi:ABC-type Fe3+/spermidine/putrescine transport system ATPase subunit